MACKCKDCKDTLKVGARFRCLQAAPLQSDDDKAPVGLVDPSDGCKDGKPRKQK
jgi:hypothetical protein